MSLSNEIINKKGYAILPINNMAKFNKLRNQFIKRMNISDSKKNINILRRNLAKMNKSEINKCMVNLLTFTEASNLMIESCSDIVSELSGNKIFVQRRAATIFNLPGKDQRRQWPHYELMSGISPFTFVLWAPFHDLDDDGGVFYLNQDQSNEYIKREQEQGLVNSPLILNELFNHQPPKLKFGEVIVFNPFILHGNISFNSNLARVACSVRFQSAKQPLMQKNTDFFKFYKLN